LVYQADITIIALPPKSSDANPVENFHHVGGF